MTTSNISVAFVFCAVCVSAASGFAGASFAFPVNALPCGNRCSPAEGLRCFMCQKNAIKHDVPALARRGLLALALLPVATGRVCQAKPGDVPKFKGLGEITSDYTADPSDRKGQSLYDENARAEVLARSKKITKEWSKLAKEVDTALEQGRCSEAIAALSLRMGTIKTAMRELSRIAAGGDILVRRAEGKSPKFNFNDGTFQYKPIAQLPEDLFAALNRATGQCKAKDLPKVAGEWEAAKKMYQDWIEMLAEQ